MKQALVKIHNWFKPFIYIITLFTAVISSLVVFSQVNLILMGNPDIPPYSITATKIVFAIVILYWSAIGFYLIMKSIEKKYGKKTIEKPYD